MYLPYLRSKGEEINALAELSSDLFKNTLPIIEPIGISKINLSKFKKLKDKNIPFILIVNPQLNGLQMRKVIDNYVNGLLADYSNYSLAFIITASSTQEEMDLYKGIKNLDKSFVHKSESLNIKFNDASKIKYHIFQDNKVSQNYINSFTGDNKIILTDGFQKVPRNADYPSSSLFSDKHLTFSPEYCGVSDYLIQGDNFSESGGPAVAVAIHLTTDNHSGIFIQHFVSDNVVGSTRTPEKFLEALNHLVAFTLNHDVKRTAALDEYDDLHDRKHYPGLGKNKRIALKHHIETISKLI